MAKQRSGMSLMVIWVLSDSFTRLTLACKRATFFSDGLVRYRC